MPGLLVYIYTVYELRSIQLHWLLPSGQISFSGWKEETSVVINARPSQVLSL